MVISYQICRAGANGAVGGRKRHCLRQTPDFIGFWGMGNGEWGMGRRREKISEPWGLDALPRRFATARGFCGTGNGEWRGGVIIAMLADNG